VEEVPDDDEHGVTPVAGSSGCLAQDGPQCRVALGGPTGLALAG
jgi:hypothetical protein